MVELPRVEEDGSLVFDPMGFIPDQIPLFVKHNNRFYPCFNECRHRTIAKKPLTNIPGCLRTREVWWCNKYEKDVFPLECHKCDADDKC